MLTPQKVYTMSGQGIFSVLMRSSNDVYCSVIHSKTFSGSIKLVIVNFKVGRQFKPTGCFSTQLSKNLQSQPFNSHNHHKKNLFLWIPSWLKLNILTKVRGTKDPAVPSTHDSEVAPFFLKVV